MTDEEKLERFYEHWQKIKAVLEKRYCEPSPFLGTPAHKRRERAIKKLVKIRGEISGIEKQLRISGKEPPSAKRNRP